MTKPLRPVDSGKRIVPKRRFANSTSVPFVCAFAIALGILALAFLFGAWVGMAYGASLSNASYYGPGLYGNKTACGQTLTRGSYGVAHRWLPCGTHLRICRLYRCINTTVIDRGPYAAGRDLDLTEDAAQRLCGCATWGVWLVSWKVT